MDVLAKVTEILPNISEGAQVAPAAITDADSEVLEAASSGRRKYLLIQNIGAADVWISLDGTAAASTDGFLLASNGGNIAWQASGHVPPASIHAICATGLTSTLMIYHVTE